MTSPSREKHAPYTLARKRESTALRLRVCEKKRQINFCTLCVCAQQGNSTALQKNDVTQKEGGNSPFAKMHALCVRIRAKMTSRFFARKKKKETDKKMHTQRTVWTRSDDETGLCNVCLARHQTRIAKCTASLSFGTICIVCNSY